MNAQIINGCINLKGGKTMDIYETKGIEYLFVIAFLIVLVLFGLLMKSKSTDSDSGKD